MPTTYKNLIFTKHALARMSERSISSDHVYRVIQAPDSVKGSQNSGKPVKFTRSLNNRLFHIVAQWKESEKAWLVVSVWVRGEDDKEALSTTVLLLPFRILWWIIRKIFKIR